MNGLTVGLFFELWDLYGPPALAAGFAGALLGLLGVHIVARRMVFLSASVSQMSGLGITASMYAGAVWGATGLVANPLFGGALFALLTVGLAMLDRSPNAARRDAILGVAFLLGAAGMNVVLPSIRGAVEVADVHTLMFGQAVAILSEDFTLLATVFAALAVVQLAGLRGFVAVSFDLEDARVRRLPTRALEAALLVTLAASVAVCTRILGALPAFAFSVLPAIAALRLAPNVQRAMLLAAVFGVVCGFGGYLVAFLRDSSVGSWQTLVGLCLVLAAELLRMTARLLRRFVARAARAT